MLQKLKVQPRLLILAVLVVALLASSLALQTQVAQAINTPWLTVSGRFIRDPQGNNVELRGVSLVDTAVANTRTRTAIQQTNMATDEANGWYARVVRFPVYPNAIDGTPGWLANPDTYFNNHLNPAIQNCVARQIYCIIDWHYIADYNNSTIDTTTRAFWNYVAPRYANTPNVIYELYNEPINPDNWSTWKTTAQPWVNLIRSLAPNNLILIGGPRWSQNLTSAASDPFVGSNLVYVAHIYPQHGGQSVWDSWFGNAANSVPFFITEWGWQQGGNVPTSGTQSGYGVPFSNYMESKGLSWTAWVHDPFWQPVMFDQSWNLLGGENFMGVFTRDLLFAHRNEGLPGGGGGTNTPTPTGVTATPTPTTPPGGNNTGWVSPSNQASQTGGDGNGFQTSPTSAFADGGTSIATDTNSGTNTNTSCSNTGKDRHAYFAYPLSIPGGSTVTGIEVRLDARVDSATGTRQMCVEVSWNNGATWTAVKTSAALSTTEASYILGSASDTWGRTWSASELTSANFRVRITNVSNSTSRDFFLDWAPVRVTYTGGGVTNTPTPTPTRTNTPTPTATGASPTPTPTSPPGNVRVQLRGNGNDNTTRSDFAFRVQNTGASAQSNITVRVYFTLDGSQAASSYALEKWYDQSNVATVSGPTLASGTTYYFTVNYGTASLAAGASWEFQTTLHLSNWSANYSGTNDWWHNTGTLPTAYTDWTRLPAYVNGVLAWGSTP